LAPIAQAITALRASLAGARRDQFERPSRSRVLIVHDLRADALRLS